MGALSKRIISGRLLLKSQKYPVDPTYWDRSWMDAKSA